VQASEDQLARAENMLEQLEQRRTQMAFSDKKLASVEARLSEIKRLTGDLEKSVAAIAGREPLINAVKAEVEQVHEIGARSKADLAHIAEHRAN
jgi:DNA repair ATPase RecN